MKILFRVIAMVLISSSYLSVAYAVDGAGDTYEQEADRVADKRPSPMMNKGKQTTRMQKGLKGKAATSVKGRVNTGAGARAINRDDCNPLCGMKGVGKDRAQPAR